MSGSRDGDRPGCQDTSGAIWARLNQHITAGCANGQRPMIGRDAVDNQSNMRTNFNSFSLTFGFDVCPGLWQHDLPALCGCEIVFGVILGG